MRHEKQPDGGGRRMALYCGRRRSGHLFNLLRKGCSCLASSLAPNSTELAAIQVPSSIKSLSVSALDGGLSGGHRRLGVVRAAQSWFRSSVRERERKQKGDCAWKQEFGQRKKRRRRRREKFRGGGGGEKKSPCILKPTGIVIWKPGELTACYQNNSPTLNS